MTRAKQIPLFFLMLILTAVILIGCNKNNESTAPQNDPPEQVTMTGAELVNNRCAECHTLDRVTRNRDDEEWQEHAQRMLSKNPELFTEEEFNLAVTYLLESY